MDQESMVNVEKIINVDNNIDYQVHWKRNMDSQSSALWRFVISFCN